LECHPVRGPRCRIQPSLYEFQGPASVGAEVCEHVEVRDPSVLAAAQSEQAVVREMLKDHGQRPPDVPVGEAGVPVSNDARGLPVGDPLTDPAVMQVRYTSQCHRA
jgi:hypothetical protein